MCPSGGLITCHQIMVGSLSARYCRATCLASSIGNVLRRCVGRTALDWSLRQNGFMCGRYVMSKATSDLLSHFDAKEVEGSSPPPSWNVAPTQNVPIIAERLDEGTLDRHLLIARWGVIPSWAKDTEIGSKLINARSESILEKPSSRKAAVKRRAIVPAEGYYEWQKTEDGEIPKEQGQGCARGIFLTGRARATFTGGARPTGSPGVAGCSAVPIEAFERVDLDGVQQFGGAVSGGSGEFIEGDEPGPSQGDGQLRQVRGAVALDEIVQDGAHVAGHFIGAFGFLGGDAQQGQSSQPRIVVHQSHGPHTTQRHSYCQRLASSSRLSG